jgi:hypothetical protein
VGESVDVFCFHEKMLSKYKGDKRELYRKRRGASGWDADDPTLSARGNYH